MSSYNINLDDWYVDAVDLKAQGMSNRGIARTLFSNENLRNRLNTFFQQESVIEDVYKRKQELIDLEDGCIKQGALNAMSDNNYENWEAKDKPPVIKTEPKILYYDLELSPTKGYVWSRFKQFLSNDQILSEFFLLTHSYVWNDGDVQGLRLTGREALEENDECIVDQAWHLLHNCDILVGHNLRRFDSKKLNARFAQYGYKAPSPYKIIDTLEICKKKFAFPSNKLNDVCQYLGIGVKADTGGFQCWKDACAGSDEALEHMLTYNKQDVHLTRELYKKLRGYDNNAVNVAVMCDNVGSLCTSCGSDNISVVEGKFAYTPNSKYQVYECGECKTHLRSTSHVGKRNSLVRVV